MKSLIIYFSHTGENYMQDGIRNITVGNTEIVANYLQEITGADRFKVEPAKEYPYSYQECCDVAKEELENNKRPAIKEPLKSIEDYDIIYIGGPIWWGHYPCCLFTALENLDFKGKVVYPFSTHEGSGLGNILSDVQKICVGAEIKGGLAIQGSDAINAKARIERWCKK